MIRRYVPVKKESAKQAARKRLLAAMKLTWIREQFETFGFATCQGACQREVHDQKDAALLLDGHHIIKRSLGGKDVPSNLMYLCRLDHDSVPPTTRKN